MTKEELESRILDLKKRQEFFFDKDIELLIELLEKEENGVSESEERYDKRRSTRICKNNDI